MIVTINAENVNQAKGNKTCDVKEVDKCATALTPLTDADFLERPPKTLAEIDQWCRKFKQSVACVRQYSDKCLAEESRRTLSIIMYSMTKTVRRHCSQTKRKQELLDLSKCVGADLPFYSQHLFDLSGDMHAIRTAKPASIRIPLCCCAYQRRKELIIEALEVKCSKHVEMLETFLQGITGDLFNYACGEYNEDSDKCKNIIGKLKHWSKPLEWKSFVIPTIQIIDSL